MAFVSQILEKQCINIASKITLSLFHRNSTMPNEQNEKNKKTRITSNLQQRNRNKTYNINSFLHENT